MTEASTDSSTSSHSEDRVDLGRLLAPEIGDLLDAGRRREARQALLDLHDAEIADVLSELPDQRVAVAFRILPQDRAAEVFTDLDPDQQERLLEDLNNEQLARLFNEMDPDDRVDLFEEMPGEVVAKLLALMAPEERRTTQIILGYPPESIGRLMTPDYVTVRNEWTIGQAMAHIRKYGHDAETLHTVYVIDHRGKLAGYVRLRELVLAEEEATVESIANPSVVFLPADEDREEAVRVMERYDLPVLPVVNRHQLMVGIVTFDDVADVAAEEATEDIQKLGGMEALGGPYMAAGVFTLVRKRGVWLMILFGGGLLTVTAMGYFEEAIQKYAVLALFVPLIIASGGNSGSQAASLIIRSLAIGEVAIGDWFRVLRRELVSGLLMGLVLGGIGMLCALFAAAMSAGADPNQQWQIGLAIGITVVAVVTAGTIVGSMLPFILEAVGIDPATGSTPLVATIIDVSGLIIYFTVALLILGV